MGGTSAMGSGTYGRDTASREPLSSPSDDGPTRRSDVRQHPLAEQPDRLHDLLVRRSARVRVPQAQQERARTRRLLPALELSHAGLGIAQDQPVGRDVVQGELRAGGEVTELGEAVLPVVA